MNAQLINKTNFKFPGSTYFDLNTGCENEIEEKEKKVVDSVSHKIDFMAYGLRRDHPPAIIGLYLTFLFQDVIQTVLTVQSTVNFTVGRMVTVCSPLGINWVGPFLAS